MKVLYIDSVGPFGGASRSLYEAVNGIIAAPEPIEAYFVMQHGSAEAFYGKVAQQIISVRGLTRFDNTRVSHYHGLRWIVPLREIFHLPYTIIALLQAKRRWGAFDLIHVNEVTDIIPGMIAKALFGAPMVIHVRSLQWTDNKAYRTRWLNARLRASATAVIAINQNTRESLPEDLEVDVIQNSFTPQKNRQPTRSLVDRLASLRRSSFKVGFVGNLHVAKGVLDLLEAVRLLRNQNHDIECIVVGGVTIPDTGLKAKILQRLGLAQNIEAIVKSRVQEYGIHDSFHMLGSTDDIQSVYEVLDVIAFPSYFDAPGRPVFEAAFSGVPSIVCIESPRSDTFVHGDTGLSIPPKSPSHLAAAILQLVQNPLERKRMGTNARMLAENNFTPALNAKKLYALYQRVVRPDV